MVTMSKPANRNTGSETTATTLCGICNSLVQNPEQLHRLQNELRCRFGAEQEITLRALQNLPFLNAVISEGLRMCNPVAGGILRKAPEGGAIVCGLFLPEGVSSAIVNSFMIKVCEEIR
jgi:hypothetical protein